MPTKITLIGAGSVVFAKNLISDILQFPELSDCHLCLMDIDPSRLKVAEVMARKVVAKLRVAAQVSSTLDRTDAIREANYVICTIQVGGYKPGTLIDFDIPKKYGLKQTIADTLGIGGIFRALRTIPKLIDIARDIETVGASGCLFLNYTNPMAMNCMAVDRAVGTPMVGLCHSVQGTSKQLATYAGLNYDEVTYKVAGINHMAFFLEYQYRGRDAYPLLFKLLEDPDFKQDKVRFEMMRRLGYFVTESSEHQAEYTPHFIHHGDDIVEKFEVPIDEYLRRCESIIDTWQQTEAELLGRDGEIKVKPQTHEYGSYIIHSMETGTPRVIYGNVPNTGLIANLPDRCCVELPILVDKSGLQPTHIGALPPQLAAICRTNINPQELAVQAALTLKREHVYHAAMADPHTAATLTLDKIWQMCDELIDAHSKEGYLPEYAPTLSQTGRGFAGTGDKVFAAIRQDPESQGQDALTFILEAANETGHPYEGQISIEIASESTGTKILDTIDVSLENGRKAQYPLDLPSLPRDESYTLCPVDSSGKVAGQPRLNSKRQHMEMPVVENADTLASQGAEIELEFMSVPLATGKAAIHEDKLLLDLRVADTDVETNARQPMDKSSVHFFFSRSDSSQGIEHFYLLPQDGEAPLHGANRLEAPAHRFATKIDKAGYATRGHIDLKSLGINDGEPFLFDFIVSTGALGDAHGACTVGWSGKQTSREESAHYAYIVPKPA